MSRTGVAAIFLALSFSLALALALAPRRRAPEPAPAAHRALPHLLDVPLRIPAYAGRPTEEIAMIRKASAVWNGNGKEGKGSIDTGSGVLSTTPYGFNSRFEDGAGTNPEELLAAAHAGCFTMALAFALEKAGHTADELRTECAVSLGKDGDGFRITRSALSLKAAVRDIDHAEFERIAQGAKDGCPVSKLFDTEITLDIQMG
jgi:osmotically inducible protein OsmC